MNGSEYIAEFLAQRGVDKVFLLTGGACAFMVDAVARHPALSYTCFHHEQSAAMAADAIWRVARGKVGVTMATSGPGAVNLLTGIACSYFDSIPTIHITGQVNLQESAKYLGAKVRQAGFQETDIVQMARPITKYAVQVKTAEDLRRELTKAYNLAITGRMGPVLIDVPMNVQQMEVGDAVEYLPPETATASRTAPGRLAETFRGFLNEGERPMVLLGAGVGLAGVEGAVRDWLADTGLPFVTSWSGMTFADHSLPGYLGSIGVYGNRGANSALQNCDRLLVLGSRLDNRQRSGNARTFVPDARVLVVDIDPPELEKYKADGYETVVHDLADIPAVLSGLSVPAGSEAWRNYVASLKQRYYGRDISTFAERHGTLSPYAVIERINRQIAPDAIVAADTGACLCWLYQTFHRTAQTVFTAAGNSPMGYSLPAAIGAALEAPGRQVICFAGDGGFQTNIQELQVLVELGLPVTIVVVNNRSYGIIKQFQDSYLGGRHAASAAGYSVPDLSRIAHAYGLAFTRVTQLDDIRPEIWNTGRPMLVEVVVDPDTLIEPKLEMGRPINDQFPYVDAAEFQALNRFVTFNRS